MAPGGDGQREDEMAKLFLTLYENDVQRLCTVLLERLSNEYDVFVSRNWDGSDHVQVRKSTLMGITVATRPKKDGTQFMTAYAPGSKLIAVPLVLLVIPFLGLSRSPSRYELEAEVIEAIRDTWPEATPLD
jgi:hypothetical protein